MRLTQWASDPTLAPPPIPLSTDIVNSSNVAYRVGAIPPLAIADDLAAAGLTFAPGRGNGYRRNGESIDPYNLGDLVADVFADASRALRYYLDTDERMLTIQAEERLRDAIPFRDRDERALAARGAISSRIRALETPLLFTRADLVLAADSLAATARSIRGIRYVREEAIRRFRSALPPPARQGPATPGDVDKFLANHPPGLALRADLHRAALAAGLNVGSRTLYAAATERGWRLTRRKGYAYFDVPASAP